MAVSCIIYDLDGTLIDSAPDIANAVNRVRANYDLDPISIDLVRQFIGDGPQKLLERAIVGLVDDRSLRPERCLPRSWTDIKHLLDQFRGWYGMDPVIDTTLLPFAQEMLQHWNALGCAQVVLTNKPHDIAEAVLDQLDILPMLDLVVGRGARNDEGKEIAPKPSSEVIDYILDETGAERSETWVIGDGIPDIQVAIAGQLPVIVLLDGYGNPEALTAIAPELDHCVTNLQSAHALLSPHA